MTETITAFPSAMTPLSAASSAWTTLPSAYIETLMVIASVQPVLFALHLINSAKNPQLSPLQIFRKDLCFSTIQMWILFAKKKDMKTAKTL